MIKKYFNVIYNGTSDYIGNVEKFFVGPPIPLKVLWFKY